MADSQVVVLVAVVHLVREGLEAEVVDLVQGDSVGEAALGGLEAHLVVMVAVVVAVGNFKGVVGGQGEVAAGSVVDLVLGGADWIGVHKTIMVQMVEVDILTGEGMSLSLSLAVCQNVILFFGIEGRPKTI